MTKSKRKEPTKTKEQLEFEHFDALRSSGALGGGGFMSGSTYGLSNRFGGSSAAPVRPVKVRDTEPLTSETFANLMEALDSAGAHDLKYLKMSEYLTKTGKLLDIPMPQIQLGYSDKAECATDRVNFPVMASIYEAVGKETVSEYVQQLSTLPALCKDVDYQDAASAMLRAVSSRTRIQEAYPGFQQAWQDFFGDLFVPGFKSLPNLADEPERKLLFEALSSIVQGRITAPELREHQALLEQATEMFNTGTPEQFGDMLYAVSAALTDTPPPEPPSDPDDEGDEDGDPTEQDGENGEGEGNDQAPGNSGSGDAEGGSDSSDQGGESDSDGDSDWEGESDPVGQPNQNGEGEGDAEEEEESDPFSQLAQFMRNSDPKNMPDPKKLGVSEAFQPDEVNFDPSGLEELLELAADVTIPETSPGLHSVFYKTPAAPGAGQIWNLMKSTYRQQVMEVERLIDEFYRVKTINERGLMSGRADAGRLYKVNFGARDVFKRAHVDSVGHMKMILLLDESGSMSSYVEDFKLPDENVLDTLKQFLDSGNTQLMRGEKVAEFNCTRGNLARLMGFLLVEASKQLDGFDVEVAGYTGASEQNVPERVQGIHRAVRDMIDKAGGRGTYGSPVVRFLGDKRAPLGIMSSGPVADNADIQALAYAIEKLEKDSSDQKCVVFAADGCVYDSQGAMPKLLARAKKAGIYVHFMDMSEGDIPDDSPLNDLPKTEVNSFKTMMQGLTTVLQTVTSEYL